MSMFPKFRLTNLMAGVLAAVVSAEVAVAAPRRPSTRAEIIPPSSPLTLASPGKKGPIDYERHGEFTNVGTDGYRYVIKDKKGLSAAAGEGIFPNTDVARDPRYLQLVKEGRLQGSHWTFVDGRDAELNFYKWASTAEAPGVKQFFTAIMLERAGLLEEAIKAYYAIAVHFPKAVSYTYYKTPWYIGPTALDRIEQLLRRHPSIKMRLEGGRIHIKTRYDNNVQNDDFEIDPGRLVAVKKRSEEKPVNLAKLAVRKTVGGPRVQLKQYENGHWQFLVEGKPFPIRAITYSVTPVGRSPDRGTWDVSRDWQLIDTNKNGIHDGFYESYVDTNGNGRRDPSENIIGDGKLLQEMGVNTLRAYHHIYDKELMRRLHGEHGLHVLCGDLLGAYAVGSGATWADGTDYTNPKQQETMLAGVRRMVEEFKDEPYILMWVLGNENVYGVASNAGTQPEAFFDLVNRAAELIRSLDPTRPVAVANGDLLFLDIIKEKCPSVDVIGANAYRGEQGFGRHFYLDVQEATDKPVLVTEYGCSAIAEGYTREEAGAFQAMYLANNWEDMEANMAGRGVGNALGGVLFEYMDEWWKANSDLPESVQKERGAWYAERSAIYKSLQPENHDDVPQFGFPFLDGWSYEEWYGVVSQGNGSDSPFLRVLRPAYTTMQKMWNP